MMSFSRASRADLLSLKSELRTDPNTLGYAASLVSQDYRDVANRLNTTGAETIDPARLTAMELQSAVNAAEFEAITEGKKIQWSSILQAAGERGIDATNPNIRAQMMNIWAAGSTRNSIRSLQTRPASRMEILFGENSNATPQAIGRALNQI